MLDLTVAVEEPPAITVSVDGEPAVAVTATTGPVITVLAGVSIGSGGGDHDDGDHTTFATAVALAAEASARADADVAVANAAASDATAKADAAQAAAIAASQPVDADLTAIALLSTTAYGRNLLTLANLAALHAVLGSGTPSATTFLSGTGWSTPGPAMLGTADFTAADAATVPRPSGYAHVFWFTSDLSAMPANMDDAADLVYRMPAVAASTITGSQSTSSHTANAGVMYSTAAGGTQATSTTTANAGTMVSNGISGAQAAGTHTANGGALVSAGALTGSQATGTDTANSGLLYSTAAAGSQAASTSTANAGAFASQGITGAQATGTHTANAGALASSSVNATPSHIASSTTNDNATSYTTASVTIPGGQVSLIAIGVSGAGTTVPTLTQSGVTWAHVATAPGSTPFEYLFRCAPASGQTGTITIDFGSDAKTGCGWTIVTVEDSIATNNGADGLGTAVTVSQGSGTTISATLAALANSRSASLGFLKQSSINSVTEGSGFALLGTSALGDPGRLASEWKQNSTTVDYSVVVGVTRLIAIEVKAV